MKGFYIYCIREKRNSKFPLRGIDDGEVFVIQYLDLEAVVSEVFVEKFNSEEIQRKAKEDLEWIKKNAEIHEEIIEEAMNFRGEKSLTKMPVIPMKFGAIFKTKKKLKNVLKKCYEQFKKTLKNLRGKQEWGVKAYLDKKLLDKEAKKASLAIKLKEKEIASMPEGIAYFAQKQIDDIVSEEADEILQSYIGDIFETLKKYAEGGIKSRILDKELTGKSLPMILNAAFLVTEKKLRDFEKEINKLNKKYKPKGFTFEYSGPWPPYNFVC